MSNYLLFRYHKTVSRFTMSTSDKEARSSSEPNRTTNSVYCTTSWCFTHTTFKLYRNKNDLYLFPPIIIILGLDGHLENKVYTTRSIAISELKIRIQEDIAAVKCFQGSCNILAMASRNVYVQILWSIIFIGIPNNI